MAMAMAGVVVCGASISGATVNRRKKVGGLNSFGGLKAHNSVLSLGQPMTTEKCFAKMVNSFKVSAKSKRGGALSSTCNAAGEIFQIAAIMNGLVLVGVAVGFVLLRVEAWVEESE
ncbi:Cytochrome b6-f complex subunit 7 [Senna tora]|uniref:Cytochrome b6-f complex subunit 7 n=1 Tax=Senna tora TaxID=362788 RepID=A0A834TYL2_9FABA|nr:Cytochrome b6-f complex subunit 7 [Senna tora]